MIDRSKWQGKMDFVVGACHLCQEQVMFSSSEDIIQDGIIVRFHKTCLDKIRLAPARRENEPRM